MSADVIRQVLLDHGRLTIDVADLTDNTDLYSVGLSSHAVVSVMLGLEDAFDMEFPDELLSRSTFSSIASIGSAIKEARAS